MADDEGAAYWEGVYGQPIHVYAADRERGSGGPGGELERMTDDEYAAYVRQKMWEKTHAGAIEERARRARERDAAQLRQEEGRRIQAEIERSLRRGEQRRKRRVWTDRWDGYLARWAAFAGAGGGSVGVDVPQASSGAAAAAGIPWPVDRADGAPVDEQSVRVFFVNGLGLDELGEKESAARLKDERVRWHPDKMQQRLGGHVDAATMRDVTAIFQAIDALWNDSRKSAA
ncbi:hypothetical protein B0T24DRAFT_614145 [Lasiosphaeria ovina]|uniref:Uncharacterized protein n=1 Tax=Lasiosphaeria ovina TaxID=92902 RepID=A0AAE0TU23_9PEZI|nr:hypothetical protein B0T24DRAFT_614145 [Lasiosphaeria ovina]